MTRRMACVVVLTVVVIGCGNDQTDRPSDAARRPASITVVRSCADRVEGRLPPGWERNSLRVGPLAFAYGGGLLSNEERRGELVDEKMLLVLKARHQATVVVPPSERGSVSLDYNDRGTHFPPRLSDGAETVRFIACRGHEKPFSPRHPLWRETQFAGGIIARWPRCVDLDVFIDGRDTPERATMSFGAGRCA